MLTRYIRAAMRHASFRWLAEDQVWFGEIPELSGVWATGNTEDDCRVELQDVLEEWIALGIRLGHSIPRLDNVEAVVEAVS